MFRLRTAQKRFRNIPFSPSALFQTGDILLWYDPSDLSTMFKDTIGTQPVTADGDSVALMLDKGQWGGKTLEQVRDSQENVWPQSSAAWALLNPGVTANAAVVTVNRIAGSTVGSVAASNAVLPTIAGYVSYWEVTISDFVFAETASLRIGGSGTLSAVRSITGNGTFSGYSYAPQTSGTINVVAGGGDFKITATVKLIPGYHRTQATGTSMPKYKTDGTLHWLLYDGTDDSHATGTITWGTDEVAVCAGVTKSSDAATGMLTELSATLSGNNGTFYLVAPAVSGTRSYGFASKGTSPTTGQVTTGGVFAAAPDTAVISAKGKISTDLAELRRNTVVEGVGSIADQGTGNFGSYPLYFGRRGDPSLPFNGREYQTVIRSRLLSAVELSSLETFVAAKTGVIL